MCDYYEAELIKLEYWVVKADGLFHSLSAAIQQSKQRAAFEEFHDFAQKVNSAFEDEMMGDSWISSSVAFEGTPSQIFERKLSRRNRRMGCE
jgi:hypothetical protein